MGLGCERRPPEERRGQRTKRKQFKVAELVGASEELGLDLAWG